MNLADEVITKIKSYTFTEIAVMYFPQTGKTNARRNLRNWIKTNKNLKIELKNLGYNSDERGRKTIFTPKMVEIIFKNFNPPESNYVE
jgi:hypothetical protein